MSVSVVVAGALAGKPHNGGEAWVRLSYVLGFRRLGARVTLIEEVRGADDGAVDFFRQVVSAFDIPAALVDAEGNVLAGELPPRADLLVNISGNLRNPGVAARAQRRAYVDIDPGYTQYWAAQGLLALDEHDVYFSIGANVGSATCPIPTLGLTWLPTRPPVVLEEWPARNGPFDRFTTVASWRGPYGRIEADGRRYGIKLDEFRRLVDLPVLAPYPFEAALDIHPADRADLARLQGSSWRVVDPRAVAADPDAFREYVARSSAEFSVAQGIYVETNSGWFSDRTVRYLASGRPALVQETGFSQHLPSGEGLVAFSTLEDAVVGADRIVGDYDRHAVAARALAEEYFDSDRVLGRLLEQALA